MTDKTDTNGSADLAAQRAYAQRIVDEGFDFGLTIADAFVRGIRDIGYIDTGRALDELIDNSIQAEANRIMIAFGFEGKSDNKPTAVAVIDNGHGMDPLMIRLAAIWGGTHREDDRHGFGRYGYGLPSASVSQGRRFTIYSLVEGGHLHAVTLDLDEVSRGAYTENGRITMPVAQPAELPKWLAKKIEDRLAGPLEHGTVILIDKLDRLTWRTRSALERHLLEGIGTTYRNYLRGTTIWVGDKKVEPVDPLFITPGYRFYDLDSDRAEALDPHSFEVRDAETREPLGTVKVRYSFMPPTFAREDKSVERGKNNARFPVMADHNGIIVLREGRQIDVVSQRGWLSVNNDDRYWGVEIDVPATLDEELSITTSKQRIILSERMWELLRKEGVLANIAELRRRYDDAKAHLRVEREAIKDDPRASERAMDASEKFKPKSPETPEQRRRSKEGFDSEVDRRSRESGVPKEQIERQLESETNERRYRVDTSERLQGAPFYRVAQVGPQRVLYLNTAHRFYRDVYAGPDSTERLRSAIEVLLFSIGTCELGAQDERALFYETERGAWSNELNIALTELAKIDIPQEERSPEDEERQVANVGADV